MKGFLRVSAASIIAAEAEKIFNALSDNGTVSDADTEDFLGRALRRAGRSIRHAVDDQLREAHELGKAMTFRNWHDRQIARSSSPAFSTRRARSSSRRGPSRNILRIGGRRTAFRSPLYEMDFRPGGKFRGLSCTGPTAATIKMHERLWRNRRARANRLPACSEPTTTNDDGDVRRRQGKTKLTARWLFESAALRDKTVKAFGAVEGLKQTLGHLAAEHVARHMKE